MSLGSVWLMRKLLFCVGTEDDEENIRLYCDILKLVSIGLLCGELYMAIMMRPKLNMSAEGVRLVSSTKSGEV